MKKLLLGLLITLSQYASAQNVRPRTEISLMTESEFVYLTSDDPRSLKFCVGLSLKTENIVYRRQVENFISELFIFYTSGFGGLLPVQKISNYLNSRGQGLILIDPGNSFLFITKVSTKTQESLASIVHRFFGPKASMAIGYYDQCPVDLESLPVSQ